LKLGRFIIDCKGCGSEIPDDVQVCPRCGEALSKEEEISIKALNIEDNLDDLESEFLEIVAKDSVFKDIEEKPDYIIKKSIALKLRSSSSNPDFKLYLDGDAESVSLLQYLPSRFYFVVENISSAPISDVKVELSGPPQIKLLIKSRKVSGKRMKNRFHFTISAREPGFFILTATLTSKVGHRIAFPIEVQVEPKYPNSKETYQAPKSSTPEKLVYSGRAITAMIIIGLIGVVLLLVGILIFIEGSRTPQLAVIGLTLAVIGFIVLFIILTIGTKGQCCGCLTGCT